MRFTYCRCLRKHLKCQFLQIELNNWLLHMLQQSIKVSLIAASVEQLIYLFLTRCCQLPILPITLQRQPCPFGRQNYFNKDGYGSVHDVVCLTSCVGHTTCVSAYLRTRDVWNTRVSTDSSHPTRVQVPISGRMKHTRGSIGSESQHVRREAWWSRGLVSIEAQFSLVSGQSVGANARDDKQECSRGLVSTESQLPLVLWRFR